MMGRNKKRSHSPIPNGELRNEDKVDELDDEQHSPHQPAQQLELVHEEVSASQKRRRHRSKHHRAEVSYVSNSDRMILQRLEEHSATQNEPDNDSSFGPESSLSDEELVELFVKKTEQVQDDFERVYAVKRGLAAFEVQIRDGIRSLCDIVSSYTRADKTTAQGLQKLLDIQRQENQSLELDIADLRLQVATFSRMPGQKSDTELKDQMEDIWQQASSWVTTNFRKLKTVVWTGDSIPQMSDSSKVLLGDYLHILPGSSHSRVLQIGQAVIGFEVTRVLKNHYFGIDKDGSFGGIIRLAEASKGTSLFAAILPIAAC